MVRSTMRLAVRRLQLLLALLLRLVHNYSMVLVVGSWFSQIHLVHKAAAKCRTESMPNCTTQMRRCQRCCDLRSSSTASLPSNASQNASPSIFSSLSRSRTSALMWPPYSPSRVSQVVICTFIPISMSLRMVKSSITRSSEI